MDEDAIQQEKKLTCPSFSCENVALFCFIPRNAVHYAGTPVTPHCAAIHPARFINTIKCSINQ